VCGHRAQYAPELVECGVLGVANKPRCGVLHKLTESDVQRLAQWADAEPLTAKALLVRHLDTQGCKVHLNTLVSELKRLGFVWKRTRHSLKKPDLAAFEQAKRDIDVGADLNFRSAPTRPRAHRAHVRRAPVARPSTQGAAH
jgi:hypothetical protein